MAQNGIVSISGPENYNFAILASLIQINFFILFHFDT